jgi:hypothetical protein
MSRNIHRTRRWSAASFLFRPPERDWVRRLARPSQRKARTGRPAAARYVKGDPEDAFKGYEEAIRLKPDYALALKNRDIARKALAARSKT